MIERQEAKVDIAPMLSDVEREWRHHSIIQGGRLQDLAMDIYWRIFISELSANCSIPDGHSCCPRNDQSSIHDDIRPYPCLRSALIIKPVTMVPYPTLALGGRS